MTVTVEFNDWLAIVSCTVQLKSSLQQLKQQFKKINEGTSTCPALKTRNIIFEKSAIAMMTYM